MAKMAIILVDESARFSTLVVRQDRFGIRFWVAGDLMKKAMYYELSLPSSVSSPDFTAIERAANEAGFSIVEKFYDEYYAAASLNREGIFSAFRGMRELGAPTLIVNSLKNLSSNRSDLVYLWDSCLESRQVQLIALEESIDTFQDAGRDLYRLEIDRAVELSRPLLISSTTVSADTSYLDILNSCHKILRPATYLEIGVKYGVSMRLSAAKSSVGVDPAPRAKHLPENITIFAEKSDDFFVLNKKRNTIPVGSLDLCFIDGMHVFDYVLRDFINVEKLCHSASVVAVDDVCPRNSLEADPIQVVKDWAGDVWKLVLCLRRYRPDLEIIITNAKPTGIAVISNLDSASTILLDHYDEILEYYGSIRYSDIGNFRDASLGVVSADHPYVSDFLKKKQALRARATQFQLIQ